MQQGWMNGWMDGWMRHIKTQNKKMDEFLCQKKHPTFGVCVWRIFLKISKNKSKLH
jgi:hypothetical protein